MSGSPLSTKAAWANIRALPGSVMKPIYLLVIVLSAIAVFYSNYAVSHLTAEQGPSPSLMVGFLVFLLLTMLISYATLRLIAAHDRGEPPSLGFLLDGFFLRYVLTILVLYMALAVAGGIVAVPLFFMPQSAAPSIVILRLPLMLVFWFAIMYISLRLTCIVPVITFEDTSLFGAIGRSWRMTYGQFWPIFRVWFVVSLAILFVVIIIAVVAMSLGMQTGPAVQPTTFNYIFDFVINVIALIPTMLLSPAIYRVLRDAPAADQA